MVREATRQSPQVQGERFSGVRRDFGVARGGKAMGRGLRALEGRFKTPTASLARAEALYTRWGRWTLLLSWAPLGDVICFVAGVLRLPFWQFLLIVGFAKTARYAILAAVTAGATAWLWT